MNIFKRLKKEHEEISKLLSDFNEIGQRGDKGRRRLVQSVKILLIPHSIAETKAIYPKLREIGSEKKLMDKAEDDHKNLERIISELEQMEPEDPAWLPKMENMKQIINNHVELEEKKIFKDTSSMPDNETETLAEAYENARLEAERNLNEKTP